MPSQCSILLGCSRKPCLPLVVRKRKTCGPLRGWIMCHEGWGVSEALVGFELTRFTYLLQFST